MSLAQVLLKQNNAFGTISAAMTTGQTSITLLTGHTMPAISGNFYAVIWDNTHYQTPFLDPNVEIVLMNYSGSTNVYNITRAQESTSAATHPINSQVAMTYTAGTATNDLFILGTHVLDETNLSPGYFIWYNGSSGNYELHSGSGSSTSLPFGVFASRPASPTVGQWYLSTDTQQLYTCFTSTVWSAYPSTNHGIQTFTASGTFTAPNTGAVFVSMVGGGGGGAGGNGSGAGTGGGNGGAGGNGGTLVTMQPFFVTAGNTYTVTIGTAGTAGGAGYGNSVMATSGGTGGTSSFSTLTASGGTGGNITGGGTGGSSAAGSAGSPSGTAGSGNNGGTGGFQANWGTTGTGGIGTTGANLSGAVGSAGAGYGVGGSGGGGGGNGGSPTYGGAGTVGTAGIVVVQY